MSKEKIIDWEYTFPEGIDPECIGLCKALNSLPAVETTESCCGHYKNVFSIWFFCYNLETLSRLGRCVERNYSDGKWELLVDSCDTHPFGLFWLRTKEPFASEEELTESTNGLIGAIEHWFSHEFDKNFACPDDDSTEYFEDNEERADFEVELDKAWDTYNNGSRNVDCFEDNFTECAHAKGFREGYLYGKRKFRK